MKITTRLWLLPAFLLGLFLALAPPSAAQSATPAAPTAGSLAPPVLPYYPPRGNWEQRKPSELGMDEALLAAAVEWAKTQETDMPRDFSTQAEVFGRPLGPVPRTRALTNGIILRHGYIVAEWGDTASVDPTYSVAKSYLSTILGLTIDRGMIKSVGDRVRPSMAALGDTGYDSPHNAKITWEHHATQTSEWDGTLFGKTSTFIGKEEFGKGEMKPRTDPGGTVAAPHNHDLSSDPDAAKKGLHEPGTHYEYNDVRVNRLSLSLLRLWKRPLPEVLKSEVMDPIGASGTWVYHAYDNAAVEVDGKPMKSVSGGTRWGAGLWMSTRDHARFGLLILRRGKWGEETGKGVRQIISESWIRAATTRHGKNPGYGYLWWLNSEVDEAGKPRDWPDAPPTSFSAQGAGNNTIWIDPEHDLVVVWRWHKGGRAQAEFYKRILGAVKAGE